MSFESEYFDVIERVHRGFFVDDFFSFKDPDYRFPPSPFTNDTFFEPIVASPVFPFKTDPFEGMEKMEEEKKEEKVEKKEVKEEKKVDGKPEIKTRYFIATKCRSIVGGKKNEISCQRSGNSKTGEETFSMRKKIDGKHFTVIKKRDEDGKLETKTKFKKIKDEEEEFFLNDWRNFMFGKDGKKMEIEVEKFKSPTIEKKKKKIEEIKDEQKRLKKQKKLEKHLEKKKRKQEKKAKKREKKAAFWSKKPSVFSISTKKTVKIDGVKRKVSTKRQRTIDGEEKYYVTRKLDDKSLSYRERRKDGKLRIYKKFKELRPEEEELFMKQFAEFSTLVEKKELVSPPKEKGEEKKIEKENKEIVIEISDEKIEEAMEKKKD